MLLLPINFDKANDTSSEISASTFHVTCETVLESMRNTLFKIGSVFSLLFAVSIYIHVCESKPSWFCFFKIHLGRFPPLVNLLFITLGSSMVSPRTKPSFKVRA